VPPLLALYTFHREEVVPVAKAIVLAVGLLTAWGAAAAADEVTAQQGMVSSAHELASMAGVEILQRGGNAVDAAVATALALNVVEPNASGIGGGGFMTIYLAAAEQVIVLDYRETAPASATKDMFSSSRAQAEQWSAVGGKSVAVPGWLLGMWTALERYGTMSFADVAAPAIRLAEDGFVVHPMQTGIIIDSFPKLLAYTPPDLLPYLDQGLPIEAGMVLRQPALAGAFRLIAEQGPGVFYGGSMGKAVVAAVNRAGGAMTIEDLADYRVEIRAPVSGTYRGYRIYSVPPASSGGTHIVQLLNILEHFPMREFGHNSTMALHVMAEAMKRVFADRDAYMADTAFADVPLAGLQSKAYAQALASTIDLARATTDVAPGNPWAYQTAGGLDLNGELGDELFSTSHFSVADEEGNIVASTNTINQFFGSGVFVPEYGIILNNQMDDFAKSPSSVNAPEPGKRPLSSIAPTVVLDSQGQPFLAVGAAGATRIITAIVQIIVNAVDYGMMMDEAIEELRIYNLATGALYYEKGLDAEVLAALEGMGHVLVAADRSSAFGTANGILFDSAAGVMYGGADSRRLGAAVGY